MADNVAVTAGTGTTIAADEVVDGTLGTVKVQYVKLMDGALDGTSKAAVGANGLAVDVSASTGVGSLTETAPATDTASSGLNGRLQRLAQRLTTLLAVFPATLDLNSGNKSASTLRVTLATDQVALTNALTVSLGQTGTDGSTTVTAGGAAQNLFGATIPANGYEVVNPDPSEDLWISDTTTAVANGTGNIRVAPAGGSYTTPAGYKPIQAVSLIGATTGHKFTARRW